MLEVERTAVGWPLNEPSEPQRVGALLARRNGGTPAQAAVMGNSEPRVNCAQGERSGCAARLTLCVEGVLLDLRLRGRCHFPLLLSGPPCYNPPTTGRTLTAVCTRPPRRRPPTVNQPERPLTDSQEKSFSQTTGHSKRSPKPKAAPRNVRLYAVYRACSLM